MSDETSPSESLLLYSETQEITTDDFPHYVPTPYPDPSNDDTFGGGAIAISPSGKRAAMTLSRHGDDLFSTGDVFVMTKNSNNNKWIREGIVKAWDGDKYDMFGNSLALFDNDDGDNTLVVGSPYHDYYSNERIGDPGSAYVYTFDATFSKQWIPKVRLRPNDIDGNKFSMYSFGFDVAIYQNIIVVGAPQRNSYQDTPGSAYVFQKQQQTPSPTASSTVWNQIAKLSASDGTKGNLFGQNLAMTSDFVAITACPEKRNDGGVYIYNYQHASRDDTIEWSPEIRIASSPGSERFGYSLAAAGSTIVVGAPYTNDRQGAAYVFRRDDSDKRVWRQHAKIVPNPLLPKDYFGLEVDITPDESTIFVGAGILYHSKQDRLRVYRFDKKSSDDDGDDNIDEEWIQTQTIVPNTPLADYTQYGRNFAVSSDTVMIGKSGKVRYRRDDDRRGTVYAFEKEPIRSQGQDKKTPVPVKEVRGQQAQHPQQSKWMNLLVSLLLLYIIHKLFRPTGLPRRNE